MVIGIDIGSSIEEALTDVATFVPLLIFALVVLVVGWFIARLIRKLFHTLLKRVNFDGIVDRSGLGGYIERAGFPDSGALVAKIVYYFIMLIVLQLAISVFGDSPVQEVFNEFVAFIPKLIVALIIIVLTGAIANVVKDLVAPSVAHLSFGATLVTAVGALIWFIGGFAALDQLQVAQDIVDTLFEYSVGALFLILVIKFGIGGIWAARDRFWPGVYDKLDGERKTTA